ncbi:MAG: hypothetical protein ABGY41_01955, partial [Candidatus Poribacteria bacterium]
GRVHVGGGPIPPIPSLPAVAGKALTSLPVDIFRHPPQEPRANGPFPSVWWPWALAQRQAPNTL